MDKEFNKRTMSECNVNVNRAKLEGDLQIARESIVGALDESISKKNRAECNKKICAGLSKLDG